MKTLTGNLKLNKISLFFCTFFIALLFNAQSTYAQTQTYQPSGIEIKLKPEFKSNYFKNSSVLVNSLHNEIYSNVGNVKNGDILFYKRFIDNFGQRTTTYTNHNNNIHVLNPYKNATPLTKLQVDTPYEWVIKDITLTDLKPNTIYTICIGMVYIGPKYIGLKTNKNGTLYLDQYDIYCYDHNYHPQSTVMIRQYGHDYLKENQLINFIQVVITFIGVLSLFGLGRFIYQIAKKK